MVNIVKHYDKIDPPSDEEMDILITSKYYVDGSSRMACQIILKEELDGIVVRISTEGKGKINLS